MADFLDDVEREIRDTGVERLQQRFAECTEKGSHHWRELRTRPNSSLGRGPRYCEDCKVVELDGRVLWLVSPDE